MRHLIWLPISLTAFLAILTGIEAVRLGPLATAAIIESYHFGSEAMIENGGEIYQSRELYAADAVILSIMSISSACLMVRSYIRRGRQISSLTLFVATMAFNHVFEFFLGL